MEVRTTRAFMTRLSLSFLEIPEPKPIAIIDSDGIR